MTTPREPGAGPRLNCVVADEDPVVAGFVLRTLRASGFKAFHAYDGLSAVELVLELRETHLLVTNTRVAGTPGAELVQSVRRQRPTLPVIYLANQGRSTPEIEGRLPDDVAILREPFSAHDLLATVATIVPRSDRRQHTEADASAR